MINHYDIDRRDIILMDDAINDPFLFERKLQLIQVVTYKQVAFTDDASNYLYKRVYVNNILMMIVDENKKQERFNLISCMSLENWSTRTYPN